MNTFPLNRPLTLDEFVKGYARGGEVESDESGLSDLVDRYGIADEDRFYTPRVKSETFAPLGGTVVPPEGFPTGTVGSLLVPGATVPEGVDPLAPIQFTEEGSAAAGNLMRDLHLMRKKQAMTLEPNPSMGYMGLGFLEGGLPVTPQVKDIIATPGAEPPLIDSALLSQLNLTPEQIQAIKDEFDPQVSEEDRAAITSSPRVQVLQKISDQLKANDFSGAFQTALDAEKNVGGDFFDNIVNPDKMRYLRGPMTADEIRKFYESMPADEYAKRHTGPGNKYDSMQAMERNIAALGGKTGYIDPRGGNKAKGSIVSKIVDVAPYVFAATVAPHMIGALTGAGAGAAGAGAAGAGAAGTTAAGAAGTTAAGTAASGTGFLTGLKAAAKTVLGIPEAIGKTVATQLGASGLSPVYNKMIGNAIISGGVTGAKGGKLEDVLKSAALAAGLTFVSDKVISSVAQKLQDSRLLDAAKDIPGGDVAAVDPTVASNIVNNVSQGLENFAGEFGITTSAPSAAASGLQTLGAVGASQAAQQAKPSEQYASDEDLLAGEITIGAEAPDFGAGLETGAYTGYKLASDRGVGAETGYATPEEIAQGEITVEATPEQLDASDIAIQAIMDQVPVYDPLTGLQEVEITTTPKELDMSDPLTQVLVNRYIDVKPPEPVSDMEEFTIETDRDLNQGFLEYAPPVFTPINPADIMKDYQPTQVKSKFEELMSKYSTVENLLKAASLIGAAGGVKKPAETGVGAVYDPRAGATAGPWIDWEKVKAEADAAGMNLNTYTARNWNKIQNRALETGVTQPAQPEYNPEYNIMGGPGTVSPNTSQSYNFPGFSNENLMSSQETAQPNFDLLKYLEEYQPEPLAFGGMAKGNKVRGPGHGREDLIPALLSDGEYVIDAETMALLGNGSTDAGAKMMDGFRENIRKHKGAKLAKGGISPDAKSPLQYLRKV